MPVDNFGIAFQNTTRHNLYRSAQPDSRGLADLYQLGIKTIVKLNEDDDDNLFLGRLIKLPMTGWSAFYSLESLMAVAQRIQEELLSSDVLVHCTHGRDRTGLVCATYQLLYTPLQLSSVLADRKTFGVSGLYAVFDTPQLAALNNIARKVGKA